MLLQLILVIASMQFYAAKNIHPRLDDLRITGGKEAVPNSAPYMVYIEINPNNPRNPRAVEFCCGTLLTKRHVLTAGHCVAGGKTVLFVLAGAHKIREKESTQQKAQASKVLLHKDYDKPLFANDLAVISLKTPLKTSKYVDVVKLPKSKDAKKSYAGSVGIMFGWGMIHEVPKKIFPAALMTTNLKVLSQADCKKFISKKEASIGDICTDGSEGRGICHGDSGGPLMVNGVQIGVISRATDAPCERKVPDMYVNVGTHLTWIESAVKKI